MKNPVLIKKEYKMGAKGEEGVREEKEGSNGGFA